LPDDLDLLYKGSPAPADLEGPRAPIGPPVASTSYHHASDQQAAEASSASPLPAWPPGRWRTTEAGADRE
jgi:hypothetical protein